MGVALSAPQTVLIFSVLAFSVAADWYLHFQSSGIAQFHASHFHTCIFQYLLFQRPLTAIKTVLVKLFQKVTTVLFLSDTVYSACNVCPIEPSQFSKC